MIDRMVPVTSSAWSQMMMRRLTERRSEHWLLGSQRGLQDTLQLLFSPLFLKFPLTCIFLFYAVNICKSIVGGSLRFSFFFTNDRSPVTAVQVTNTELELEIEGARQADAFINRCVENKRIPKNAFQRWLKADSPVGVRELPSNIPAQISTMTGHVRTRLTQCGKQCVFRWRKVVSAWTLTLPTAFIQSKVFTHTEEMYQDLINT